MIEKIYFRALYTKEHLVDWKNKNFNSYHHAVPGLWLNNYFKLDCREISCFPLRFMDGIIEVEYTERARSYFLKYAASCSPREWSPQCLKACSELNGICAFDNPKDAFEFISPSPFTKFGYDRYVVFKGLEVCPLPEPNGYVAKVIEIIHDELRSDEFISLFLSEAGKNITSG